MATIKKTYKTYGYSLGRELKPEEKCTPQVGIILTVLKELGAVGDKRVSRTDLMNALTPERLKTRQAPARVFGFYRRELMTSGLLIEEVSEEIREETVPDKPAKVVAEGGAEAPAKGKKGKKGKAVETAPEGGEAAAETPGENAPVVAE